MSVPDILNQLLVLVYNGFIGHYKSEIVAQAVKLKIILVLLPYNSNNLIQTLDISVFKKFKSVFFRCITRFTVSEGNTKLTKMMY